ncbi:metallopeptidase family protein [Candidatus Saccharibacteria bacterium]|nr:metallopeptidase family protein [Candidatus Saccharibacteria bacterium]
MVSVSDEQFEKIVADGIDAIPPLYQKNLKNVAFIIEDEPTPEQRELLKLFAGETLFGLYEGVPLPQRQGTTKILPDKITIFKNPALAYSNSLKELREHVRHTIWHEVAHYYGLDHKRIHELEK